MNARALILPLAIGLAACDPPRSDSNASPPANAAAPGTAAPAGNTAAPDGEATRPALMIEAEGVRLVDPESGSARPLAFGAPLEQTIEALNRTLGGPPSERGTNAECGAGPLVIAEWGERFTALFQDDRFVGWEAGPGVSTADGIAIGSTRAQLDENYDFEVEESTLGTEFNGDGLGGLFASAAADARITALWAGTTCHFR